MEPERVAGIPGDPRRVPFGNLVRVGRDRDFEMLGIAPVDFDPRPGSDGRDAVDAYGTDAGARGTFGGQGKLLWTETEEGTLRGGR